MAAQYLTVLGLMVTVLLPGRTSAYSITLDVSEDLFMSWKLQGSYMYTPDGKSLQMFKEHLPEDFSYKALRNAKGLWLVIPDVDNNVENPERVNTSATFMCSASAQLFGSVRITYMMRGHSVINLYSGFATNEPTYTILTPPSHTYELVSTEIPFDQTGRFVIETNVTGTASDSFILIDKIVANFMDSPTRPPKPRPTIATTTSKPTPSPIVAGSSHPEVFSKLFIFSFIFLAPKIMTTASV